MSGKRAPAIVLFAAAALSVYASEWHAFAAKSDRTDNPVIIQLLSESETAPQLDIVSALGERDDPYIADIIEWIYTVFHGEPFERELLLRVLIDSFLDPFLPSDTLAERVAANRDAMERLAREIDGFQDPLLQNELLRIIDLLPTEDFFPSISRLFGGALRELKDGEKTGPGDHALLLSLLSFAERHPRGEFLQPCLDTARISRDARTVETARATAKIIADSLR
jgi:hypothetical protein